MSLLFIFALSCVACFILLFCGFIIIGRTKAASLITGLSGILSGAGAVAFLVFAGLFCFFDKPEVATFCVIASGASLAFIFFRWKFFGNSTLPHRFELPGWLLLVIVIIFWSAAAILSLLGFSQLPH